MLTKLAKMTTGLAVRGGFSAPLRIAVMAAMFAGAWLAGVPLYRWVSSAEDGVGGILPNAVGLLMTVGLFAGITFAISGGTDSRRDRGRAAWGLGDFSRRMPFTCWCVMTDDGRDIPLWALLVWLPLVPVEAATSACLLIALAGVGLWRIAKAVGAVAWKVLDTRPFGRKDCLVEVASVTSPVPLHQRQFGSGLAGSCLKRLTPHDIEKLRDDTFAYAAAADARVPCPDCAEKPGLTLAEDQPAVAAMLPHCALCDGERSVSKARALAVLPYIAENVRMLRRLLGKLGHHAPGCPMNPLGPDVANPRCDCGLDEEKR